MIVSAGISWRPKQTPLTASLMQPEAEGGFLEPGAALLMLTLLFGAVVIVGLGMVVYAFVARQRLRELAMRERIALIERGLLPAPEVDPARFERLVTPAARPVNASAHRYRSAGVMLMGLGVAILILLAFAAGVPEVGFGVGGGLAALGAAVFFNGMLMAQSAPDELSPHRVPNRRTEPPPNAGP
jgi:hypothetical protein